jgi:exosortase/archaeosortase family protein
LVAIFYVSWFPARRLRQALLVVLAPAIAYLFNLLRICVIAVAPTSEYSAAHTIQGLTVYFGAIACLILVDRVLGHLLPRKTRPKPAAPRSTTELGSQQTSESESPPVTEPELQEVAEPVSHHEVSSEIAMDSSNASRPSGRLSAAALTVLAVAMLGVSIWMPRWSENQEEGGVESIGLPAEFDGWTKGSNISIDRAFIWTVRYLKFEYWIYERDGDQVSVFIGVDDRRRRSRSLLSRKNAVPRRGFEIMERDSVSLDLIEVPVERVSAQSQLAHVLTYYWYEEIEGLISEVLRALLATDQSPFRRVRPARVIRVAIAVDSNPGARVEDEAKLRAFASSLAAVLRE